MGEWKAKTSEPGFMGLNDYYDSNSNKLNKSLNQKNHNLYRLGGSSDNYEIYKSIIELVNNG
ncbi:MAG: hypothetical protein NTX22_06975 [Ignavibacteriales bacterium]|nr:hypothetical protein [Ignavibacteriales bacterium]